MPRIGSRSRLAPGLLAAFWGLAGTAAWGHELGPFQVYGSFLRGGAFRLDVKVDEEHLGPAQLGGPARSTRYGRIAGLNGPVEQRFGRFLSDLADSFTLSFDGVPVRPTLSMDSEDSGGGGAPARATLRVAGWIPGGARTFTFSSSLPVKSYPLVLRCEEDESSTWRWVAGGATSPAYQLAPRVVPPPRAAVARRCFALGFDHVLPHGPAPLLLAAAIFLLARRVRAAVLLLAALALGQGLGLALALRGAAPIRPGLIGTLQALAIAGVAVAGLGVPLPLPRTPSRERSGARALPWPAVALEIVVVLLIGVLFGLGFAAAVPGGLAAGAGPAAAPAAPTVAPAAPTGAAPLPPPLLAAAAGAFALGAAAAELAVMAAAFLLVGLPFRDKDWYRGRVVVPACCLIAVVGLYWSLAGALF